MLENVVLTGTHEGKIDRVGRLYLPQKLLGSLYKRPGVSYSISTGIVGGFPALGVRPQDGAGFIVPDAEGRLYLGRHARHLFQERRGDILLVGRKNFFRVFRRDDGYANGQAGWEQVSDLPYPFTPSRNNPAAPGSPGHQSPLQ